VRRFNHGINYFSYGFIGHPGTQFITNHITDALYQYGTNLNDTGVSALEANRNEWSTPPSMERQAWRSE
jgi:hypothetical protein